MNLVEKDIKARDIINEKSLRNALACDMALGCSSNSVLHLLAIANEAGVELNLDIFNEFSAKVPNLCHLAPAGGTHMHDLNNAGGLPAVFSELTKKGLIDESLITATGKTVGENIKGAYVKNYDIIRPIDKPYSEAPLLLRCFHTVVLREYSTVKKTRSQLSTQERSWTATS